MSLLNGAWNFLILIFYKDASPDGLKICVQSVFICGQKNGAALACPRHFHFRFVIVDCGLGARPSRSPFATFRCEHLCVRRGHRRPRARRLRFPSSIYFFAGGNLAGQQKSFDEFTLATNGHAGKSFEPFAFRYFRFGAEPIRQKTKLVGGNFPLVNAVKQMVEQPRRKLVAANARHGYSP
jgi:hypothetical protein